MLNRFHWVPRSMTSPFSKITALIILCYIALNAFYLSMGYLTNLDNRIRGVDGVFYYVYLPSILFDQDVQFENNLTAIYGENYSVNVSDNGSATNTWAIGPAMLWLPFYILAHGLTLCLNAFFVIFPMDSIISPSPSEPMLTWHETAFAPRAIDSLTSPTITFLVASFPPCTVETDK